MAVDGRDDDYLDYLLGLALRVDGSWVKMVAEELNVILEYTALIVTRSRISGALQFPFAKFRHWRERPADGTSRSPA